MQHSLACPPPASSDPDANPSFNVVIAYEDFESGKHAKETYDFLVDNLGCDCLFTNQMWKFDVLVLPKLREMAIDDATRADLILVSNRGRELPAHVQTWITGWLTAEHKPLALVALFEPPPDEAGTGNVVRPYLAEVARKGEMEFFAEPDISRRSHERVTSRRVDNKLSTIARVLQRETDYPRWTVNE